METINLSTRIKMETDLKIILNNHFKECFGVDTRWHYRGQWKATLWGRFLNMEEFEEEFIITNDEDKVDNNSFDYDDFELEISNTLSNMDDEAIIKLYNTLTSFYDPNDKNKGCYSEDIIDEDTSIMELEIEDIMNNNEEY